MRLFLVFIPLAVASASWFGTDNGPEYSSWSTDQLKSWLSEHNIPVPTQTSTAENWHQALQSAVEQNWNSASTWTQDQYTNAQKSFSSLREDTFESWDESKLREWLLEQGIVSPKSKKEELVLLAKQRYKSYQDAAKSWNKWAADTAAAGSASVSSYAAAATTEVGKAMDASTDYVYSTWDDNRLRSYLEEKGVIKTKAEKTREQMLQMMYDSYAKVTDPVWESWSTSYIHNWLASHHIISPTPTATEKARASLVAKMNDYYYAVNAYVWDTWSDSDLRQWLVDNNVVKEKDVKNLSRDKLVQTVKGSYNNAASSITSTWTDSQLREWLVSHDYIKTSDAEKAKRGELVKLFKAKFPKSKDPLSYSAHPYVSWPTPRLRAFLVETGVKERDLPKSREELLERVSLRWDSKKNTWKSNYSYAKSRSVEDSEALFTKIQNLVNGGVEKAEDTLGQVWDTMKSYYQSGVEEANEKEREVVKEAKKTKGKVQNEL